MEERKLTQAAVSYTPIRLLKSFTNWIIKARVIKKNSLKEYKGKDGKTGKIFSIDIMDKDQNTIKGSFFDDAAIKFNNLIQIGKVYSFRSGKIKANQKEFGNSDGLALQFYKSSNILPILEENSTDIPTIQIDFTPFDKLENLDDGCKVNVIGIIVQDSHLKESKNDKGETIYRRVVELIDQHLKQIEVTIWGQNAREYQYPMHSVLAIKNGKLKTFHAIRQIDIDFTSQIFYNGHGFSQTKALKEWFLDAQRKRNLPDHFQQMKNRQSRSFFEVEQLCLKQMQNNVKMSLWNQRTCRISAIAKKDSPFYQSCPKENCWKKVDFNEEKKEFVCSKCSESFDNSNVRYLTRVKLEDDSGYLWCFIFHDQCQKLFGLEASEYKKIKDENTPEGNKKLVEIFDKIKESKFVLSIESKIDVSGDRPKAMHNLEEISDPITIEHFDADLKHDEEDSDDEIENQDILKSYEANQQEE